VANKERGEVSIDVDGKRYIFRLTVNAICEIETETGKPFEAAARELQSGQMRTVRLFVWAALRHQHPDLTLEQAGDIMTSAGLQDVLAPLVEAIHLAFPSQAKAKIRKVK